MLALSGQVPGLFTASESFDVGTDLGARAPTQRHVCLWH